MDIIIRVREAINKKGKCLLYLLSIITIFVVTTAALIDHSFAPTGIIIVFFIMILEDFKYQTIDMRFFLALLLLMAMTAADLIHFICLFSIGVLIFRVLFLFTTKIIENQEISTESKENIVFGYLPILGFSWGIYELFLSHMAIPDFLIPTCEGFVILKYLILSNLIVVGIMSGLLFLVWGIKEYHLHKAEKEKKNILYGFGDGDVFVLAGFLSYLGIETFITIFFISLLLQVGYYCLIYFLRGDFKNEM